MESLFEDLHITETEDDKLPHTILYPDYHLNVPLRMKFFEWYRFLITGNPRINKLPRYKQDRVHKFYNQSHSKLFHRVINPQGLYINSILDPALCYSHFFIYWSTHVWERQSIETSLVEDIKIIIKVTLDLFSIQEKSVGIRNKLENIDPDYIYNEFMNNQQLLNLYLSVIFVRSVVIGMNQIVSKTDQRGNLDYKLIQDDFVCIFASPKNVFACTAGEGASIFFDGKLYNLNKECLLCFSDLIHQRFNILLSSFFGELFNLPQYPLICDLNYLLRWGDEILAERGQKGFKIIKHLEPICTSVIIEEKEEQVCDNLKFWTGLIQNLEDDIYAIEKLENLKSFFIGKPNQIISQFFGLFRIWGHPLVDTISGIHKVRKAACNISPISPQLADSILHMFRILFINGFISKHGIWPSVTIDPDVSIYLQHQYDNNLKIDYHCPTFKLKDMRKIKLEKNLQTDPSFNMATMMSDKALSLGLAELISVYKKTRGIGKAESRRVILEWLKSDFISAKELLDYIDNNGFPDNEKVVGVVPKERELKTEPRLFAIMTLMARLYFVITEALLGDHLIPYFSQISMGLDGISLNKKLYNITKGQKDTDRNMFHEVVTINIDFEQWNLRMRRWLSDPLFSEFDKLFGFKQIFKLTHEFFEQSVIYVADEETELEIDGDYIQEGIYSWRNHRGGFEGQRQRGWTILTVCMIELATMPQRIRHTLIGQGDNQVLLLSIGVPPIKKTSTLEPNYNLAKDRYNGFKEHFFLLCKEAGLPIKMMETWESSHFFIYGKVPFYEGNPLCMSLKRLARMIPLTNNDFPSLGAEISTIYAAGNAATQSDLCPTVPFIMTLFISNWNLILNLKFSILCNKSIYSIFKPGEKYGWTSDNRTNNEFNCTVNLQARRVKEKFLFFVNSRPSIIGGYSIQLLNTFMSRGFPDPLTESLSMLKKMFDNSDELWQKKILTFHMLPKLQNSIRELQLVQDPVSINITVPQSTSAIIRSESMSFLKRYPIQNKHFSDLLHHDDLTYQELASELFYLEPFPLLLLSDVLEASVPGYVQSIFNKILKTSTILDQTVRSDKQMSLFRRLNKSEFTWFAYTIDHFCQSLTQLEFVPYTCSRSEADRLRFQGWGKTIRGITVPHPCEIFNSHYLSPQSPCEVCSKDPNSDHLRINIDTTLTTQPNRFLTVAGPSPPYIGSRTQEKNKRVIGATVVSGETLLKRSVNLLRTIGWFIPRESPAARLLINLLGSITDLNPDPFMSLTEEYSGEYEHRYECMKYPRAGTLSTLYNVAMYLNISTNTLRSYAKGSENTNLHYQALMIHNQQHLSTMLVRFHRMRYLPYSSAHYHINCKSCIVILPDEMIVGDDRWTRVRFPNINTKFTWINAEDVSIKKWSAYYFINSIPKTIVQINEEETTFTFYWKCAAVCADRITRFIDHNESFTYIPFVWVARSNPIMLLEHISALLLLRLISQNILKYKIHTPSQHEIIKHLLLYVQSLPPSNFSYLSLIYLDEDNRLYLGNSTYNFKPPVSIPLTTNACGVAIKNILITIISSPKFNVIQLASEYPSYTCIEFQNLYWDIIYHQTARTLNEMLLSSSCEILHHIKKIIREFLKSYQEVTFDQVIAKYWIDNPVSPFISYQANKYMYTPITVVYASLDNLSKLINRDPSYKIDLLNELWDVFKINHISKSAGFNLYSELTIPMLPLFEKDTNSYVNIPHSKYIPSSINDYSKLFYRVPALDTSAWMKVYPIINSLPIFNPAFIICCGDGTGGISALILSMFKKCHIFFNTILELKNTLPHSLPQYLPSSLLIDPSFKSRVANAQNFSDELSDITHPLFHEVVNIYIKRHGVPSLIICDAEGAGWQTDSFALRLLYSLFKIASTNSKRIYIIFKLYYHHINMFLVVIDYCIKNCLSLKLIRSFYSSEGNTECYLLIKGCRGPTISSILPPYRIVNTFIYDIKSNILNQEQLREFISNWTQRGKSLQPLSRTIYKVQQIGLTLFYNNDIYRYIDKLLPPEFLELIITFINNGPTIQFWREVRYWWLSSFDKLRPTALPGISKDELDYTSLKLSSIEYISLLMISLLINLNNNTNVVYNLIRDTQYTCYFYWIYTDSQCLPCISINDQINPKFKFEHQNRIIHGPNIFGFHLFQGKNSIKKLLMKVTGSIRFIMRVLKCKYKLKISRVSAIANSNFKNFNALLLPHLTHPNSWYFLAKPVGVIHKNLYFMYFYEIGEHNFMVYHIPSEKQKVEKLLSNYRKRYAKIFKEGIINLHSYISIYKVSPGEKPDYVDHTVFYMKPLDHLDTFESDVWDIFKFENEYYDD